MGLGGRSRIPANETANETAAEVRGMTQASPLAGEILLYLTRAARPAACLFCVMTSTALVGRSAELRRLGGLIDGVSGGGGCLVVSNLWRAWLTHGEKRLTSSPTSPGRRWQIPGVTWGAESHVEGSGVLGGAARGSSRLCVMRRCGTRRCVGWWIMCCGSGPRPRPARGAGYPARAAPRPAHAVSRPG